LTSGREKVKRAWQSRQTFVVVSPRTEVRPVLEGVEQVAQVGVKVLRGGG
jgi:hypothetical protein